MVDFNELTGEQKTAITALDRNVILTAGAGTGKTTTLTERYLKMIEESIEAPEPENQVDLLPENILTTTFTDRAANELEESVRQEITDRISSLDEDEFEDWRTVADELDKGYIHTLHGFCSRLLREHALSVSGVDPGFDPIDEDETKVLIRETVSGVLEEYEDHDAMRSLSTRFDRSQLQSVLCDLLHERPESVEWAEDWDFESKEEYVTFVERQLHPIDAEEAAVTLANPEFVNAVETIKDIVNDPPDVGPDGDAWGRAVNVLNALESGFDDGAPSDQKQDLISELSNILTTGKNKEYNDYTGAKTQWGGHPLKSDFDESMQQIVRVLNPEEYALEIDFEIDSKSFPLVRDLAELTLIAAEEYSDRKRQQNVLDFTDLVSKAVELLDNDENEELRQELREQFEYVMVDEFQDTDPRQWDLIRLLTTSEKEAFDADNVFIVGDAKQSIYRFRNADVAQFQETAEMLEETIERQGSDPKVDDDQLSTNFRTLPRVLETINELFESIFMVDGESFEAEPQRLTADREDPASIGSVEYLLVPENENYREARFDQYEEFATADPDDTAELEAMALASRLSQVISDPYEVYPEDNGDDDEPPMPEKIRPEDIAILIRSRTNLKTYERALDEAGVPYSIASGVGFYDTPEITALMNLFRTLADPDDERALYATLRSPLFGFTDDTLAQLKHGGKTLWNALAAAEDEQLADVHEHMESWRQMAGVSDDGVNNFDGSWGTFLTQIIDDTGYKVNISAGDRPTQARANVDKFRQQLQGMSDDEVRSLPTLVRRLEQRIEEGGRESEAETIGDGVQILTIHDAKGMEFPFVVVPDIGKEFQDKAAIGDGSLEFEKVDGEQAVGMKAPSPDDPLEMENTMARITLRQQRREKERAEEKRILYVACTRARDHLLLSGLHEFTDDDDIDDPTLKDLAGADPESASSYRDWVQPEFLNDGICEQLEETTAVQQEYGRGRYTVRIPTPPEDVSQDLEKPSPAVELSPEPSQPDILFNLSATDLASFLGGYGELHVDEKSRLAYIKEPGKTPDTRHGPEEATTTSEPGEDQVESSEQLAQEVDARVFGEMVHRLCELRPPKSEWAAVMEQTMVGEGVNPDALTTDLQEKVGQQADRGISFVEKQCEGKTVRYQYDELYVTAEFAAGQISGYIDHLLVTPDYYHIIDYKTGDVSKEQMEADAEYYANQMKAYAMALHQQDTGRKVKVSLYFSAIDQAWETEWNVEDIDAMEAEISSRISKVME